MIRIVQEAQRWNFKTRKYTSYMLPLKASLIEDRMDVKIECADCSKDILYGDGLTSRSIHNSIGQGYIVCDECYSRDWDLQRITWVDEKLKEGEERDSKEKQTT